MGESFFAPGGSLVAITMVFDRLGHFFFFWNLSAIDLDFSYVFYETTIVTRNFPNGRVMVRSLSYLAFGVRSICGRRNF
jgi:hypothetical protein